MENVQELRIQRGWPSGNIDREVLRKEVGDVDMGYWGATTSDVNAKAPNRYLHTNGAAPCLNVVLHNPGKLRGCLAHISYGDPRYIPSGNTSDDQDQSKLYKKAIMIIASLIKQCRISEEEPLLMWLGAGQAFYPQSPYAPNNPIGQPFPEFLSQNLPPSSNIRQILSDDLQTMDTVLVNRPDSAQVLYYPSASTVYILTDDDERKLYTDAPPNDRVQPAKIGGKCSDLR
jgi:hypothetical protein